MWDDALAPAEPGGASWDLRGGVVRWRRPCLAAVVFSAPHHWSLVLVCYPVLSGLSILPCWGTMLCEDWKRQG